jgi:hypothetical protein
MINRLYELQEKNKNFQNPNTEDISISIDLENQSENDFFKFAQNIKFMLININELIITPLRGITQSAQNEALSRTALHLKKNTQY